jgi:putative CRISPR-associated protein (TIGR02620 family)
MQTQKIVITRHAGLVEYLLDQGIITVGNYTHITHATPADVKDQDVIGILPLNLAVLATTVTIIPLNLPPELRGVELTASQVASHAGSPQTVVVTPKPAYTATHNDIPIGEPCDTPWQALDLINRHYCLDEAYTIYQLSQGKDYLGDHDYNIQRDGESIRSIPEAEQTIDEMAVIPDLVNVINSRPHKSTITKDELETSRNIQPMVLACLDCPPIRDINLDDLVSRIDHDDLYPYAKTNQHGDPVELYLRTAADRQLPNTIPLVPLHYAILAAAAHEYNIRIHPDNSLPWQIATTIIPTQGAK